MVVWLVRSLTFLSLAFHVSSTALRDINDLVEKGILVRSDQGSKNTSYTLVTSE